MDWYQEEHRVCYAAYRVSVWMNWKGYNTKIFFVAVVVDEIWDDVVEEVLLVKRMLGLVEDKHVLLHRRWMIHLFLPFLVRDLYQTCTPQQPPTCHLGSLCCHHLLS